MSRRHEPTWSARRCAEYAARLDRLVEMDLVASHCRPAADHDDRPGLVVEWALCGRAVELYLAWTGAATVVWREGAPRNVIPFASRRDPRLIDELRGGILWLDSRRDNPT